MDPTEDHEDLIETIAQAHCFGATGVVGREVSLNILRALWDKGYTVGSPKDVKAEKSKPMWKPAPEPKHDAEVVKR